MLSESIYPKNIAFNSCCMGASLKAAVKVPAEVGQTAKPLRSWAALARPSATPMTKPKHLTRDSCISKSVSCMQH